MGKGIADEVRGGAKSLVCYNVSSNGKDQVIVKYPEYFYEAVSTLLKKANVSYIHQEMIEAYNLHYPLDGALTIDGIWKILKWVVADGVAVNCREFDVRFFKMSCRTGYNGTTFKSEGGIIFYDRMYAVNNTFYIWNWTFHLTLMLLREDVNFRIKVAEKLLTR